MTTNLLDLNNDILNVIGDYFKKRQFNKRIRKRRTNSKREKIRFGEFNYRRPYIIYYGKEDITKNHIKIIYLMEFVMILP